MRTLTLTLLLAGLTLFSCKKGNDEIQGCVYGKSKYFAAEFKIGCMSRAEFLRYLDYPTFEVNGFLIDRDLRFVKVDHCSECQ